MHCRGGEPVSGGRVFAFNVDVSGFLRRMRELRGVAADPDVLEAIAQAGADVFEAEAKLRCPKVTGALADSIHTETIERSATRAKVGVGTNLPYAKRVEFGHARPTATSAGRPVRQAPQPYMRPAYDTKKEEARRAMREVGREQFAEVLAG